MHLSWCLTLFLTPVCRLLYPHSTGESVYCFTSVCPSQIFFVAFFSATIDGRNLIFNHKLHIVGSFFGPIRFLLPVSDLVGFYTHWTYMRRYHKWALAHSSSCLIWENIECSPLLVTNVNIKKIPPFDQRQITVYISIYHCCGSFLRYSLYILSWNTFKIQPWQFTSTMENNFAVKSVCSLSYPGAWVR